jgi:parvulin-like peptidyl-prolyl isomerase
MSVKIKFFLATLLLALVATLVACTQDSEKPEAAEAVPDAKIIVARVNGEPVYETDVLRRMRAAHGGDIDEVKKDPNRWQMLLDVATETEVMDKLLLQAALADGMAVSTEEARELLTRTKDVAGTLAFSEMLAARDANEEALRDFLMERELINRYKDKLFAGLVVDEDALRNYYEGHAETFAEPDKVRLEVFTFGGRETAVKIYEHWKSGESFDSIAQAYHDEAEQVGRRTRWMPMNAVPAELRSKVTEAEAGTILEPTQVFDTFYVVRVVEKRGARIRGIEEVKDEIGKTILTIRQNKVLDEWYKVASREATIEYVH